ncbi:MAG: CCA tRNA nucleotidyltransferase [Desulfuromusa sp.]|nr:CCA tRNA nucleotidyltransferase [Desulfuromusa sp.]
MFSEISALTKFINLNPDLKLLISSIQKNDNDFWLVGGCLRNFLLDLPQVDIDIACSCNPTVLAKSWAAEVAGRWFWLDSKRKQSRVLLKNGLTVDFTPLRAPSIIEDLQLRDFTINALALPLDTSFPGSELLDPLAGVNHLQKRQLHTCSDQSFPDDPLRMMKGIRHAVTLDFDLSADTRRQILSSVHLLANVSGERIRDELGKILAAENVVNGIEFLIDTGLLGVLFGPPDNNWDRHAAIDEINRLNVKIQEIELVAEKKLSSLGKTELFSSHVIFLFAQLLKYYSPSNLPDLLHNRLRLSRTVQRLLEELQAEPDLKLFSLAVSIEGQRRQALVFEQMEPFTGEKMFFWGVCYDLLSLERVLELQKSFSAEQKLGRIPDLLNGRLIASLLAGSPDTQIGEWQSKMKLAEINGEIEKISDAENWLKNKLSFDNKET